MGYSKLAFDLGKKWYLVALAFALLAILALPLLSLLHEPFAYMAKYIFFMIVAFAAICTFSMMYVVFCLTIEVASTANTKNLDAVVEAFDLYGYKDVRLVAMNCYLENVDFEKGLEIHKRVTLENRHYRYYGELFATYSKWKPESLDQLFLAFEKYQFEDVESSGWTAHEYQKWFQKQKRTQR